MDPLTSPPAHPKASLRWSGMTHPGRVRPNNEDAFLTLTFDGHEVRYLGRLGECEISSHDFIFAVSDGMGGERSGEFASQMSVDRITKIMPRSFRTRAMGLQTGFTDVLSELFTRIHADLINLGRSYEECAGMGATLSLCWLTPEWFYFGHIGDSRVYYLPAEGGITQLTHDDTHVGWLFRNGQINEREARTHPRRNALQQALGARNQFIDPQFGSVGWKPGDRFVICSDGLTEGLWNRQIEEVLGTPDQTALMPDAARNLIDASLENGGSDNLTAVVFQIQST